ncbi:MAG: hypothetical protein P8I13_02950, partial [Porticoccaceae bacterium]|nr:hypothetical protein [Porticoccaceae bacterium]
MFSVIFRYIFSIVITSFFLSICISASANINYADEVVIFKNGATTAAWQPGLNGYDQDNGWGACPDATACPNLDFGIVNDSER